MKEHSWCSVKTKSAIFKQVDLGMDSRSKRMRPVLVSLSGSQEGGEGWMMGKGGWGFTRPLCDGRQCSPRLFSAGILLFREEGGPGFHEIDELG